MSTVTTSNACGIGQRAPDYKNGWQRGVSDVQRKILEDYVGELCALEQRYHLKLLKTNMDPMESSLRLNGVNRSDP